MHQQTWFSGKLINPCPEQILPQVKEAFSELYLYSLVMFSGTVLVRPYGRIPANFSVDMSICPSFLLLCVIKVMPGYTELSRERKLIFIGRRSVSTWVIMICLS